MAQGDGRGSTFVWGWLCTGPQQPRWAIVQLEAQAIHFFCTQDRPCVVNDYIRQEMGLFKQNTADLEE